MKEKLCAIVFLLLVANVICNSDENLLRPRRLEVKNDDDCRDASISLGISCGKYTAAAILTDGIGAVVLSELRTECLLDLLKWPWPCKSQIKAAAQAAVKAYCQAFPAKCNNQDPCAPSGGTLYGNGQSPPCAGCMRSQGSNMCWYCEGSKSYTEQCKCPQHCQWGCDLVTGKCKSCDRGWWGATCANKCGEHCLFDCHQETGECGFCERGWWGPTCPNKCGQHCIFDCDKKTGECGFCERGWWGTTCPNKCGQNCMFDCDKKTGTCGFCQRGWFGTTCAGRCPGKCVWGCHKVLGTC